MINIAPHAEGCILPLRAQPGSRKTGIQGEYNGALKIAVNVAPEKGKANEALIELLAELLGVKKSQIELLSGETSQDKRFLIRTPLADLKLRVGKLLP